MTRRPDSQTFQTRSCSIFVWILGRLFTDFPRTERSQVDKKLLIHGPEAADQSKGGVRHHVTLVLGRQEETGTRRATQSRQVS